MELSFTEKTVEGGDLGRGGCRQEFGFGPTEVEETHRPLKWKCQIGSWLYMKLRFRGEFPAGDNGLGFTSM